MKARLKADRFPKTRRSRAFTLIEMLASITVLLILAALVAQLVGSATKMTGLSNKKQEADVRARLLFGRLALDLGMMLKRDDVDYFLKDAAETQPGNDQIAFYSEVSGYYPSGYTPGALSLVAYRINPDADGYGNCERLGKGLAWLPDGSGEDPPLFLPETIAANWPEATNAAADDDYEELGPGIFRFEYFYVLNSGELSAVPWDAAAGHTGVDGLRDVVAIMVVVAAVDPAVRVRLQPSDMTDLAGQMNDFDDTMKMGDLEKQWQAAVNAGNFTQKSGASVRIHSRCFPLEVAE